MYFRTLQNPRVGVVCTHNPKNKEFVLSSDVEEPIIVVNAGTQIAALDDDYKVLSQDGEVIHPHGHFFRTVTTIDPYHIILDM